MTRRAWRRNVRIVSSPPTASWRMTRKPLVLTDGGQLGQQHGLADAAQAGERLVLVERADRMRRRLIVAASRMASRPTSAGGGVPAPGAYGLATGSYRSPDMPEV